MILHSVVCNLMRYKLFNIEHYEKCRKEMTVGASKPNCCIKNVIVPVFSIILLKLFCGLFNVFFCLLQLINALFLGIMNACIKININKLNILNLCGMQMFLIWMC